MKQLSVHEMERLNGGNLACTIGVTLVGLAIGCFWCGVAADVLICNVGSAS